MIPRTFHQIYLRGGALPTRLARNVAEVKQLNPGWEHRLYDARRAEAFIVEAYGPDTLATYKRIDPKYGAARADFLRHLLIYKLGGVYLDIKSALTKPLDHVLRPDDCYILTQWSNQPGQANEGFGLHRELSSIEGGEYQVYHIIATAGHPFSEAVIERIRRNIKAYRPWSAVGRTGVLRTTGPIAYTLAIHPMLRSAPHRFATEQELGLVASVRDYDHFATFEGHYSTLTTPVVRFSAPVKLLSRAFVSIRDLKTRAGSRWEAQRAERDEL